MKLQIITPLLQNAVAAHTTLFNTSVHSLAQDETKISPENLYKWLGNPRRGDSVSEATIRKDSVIFLKNFFSAKTQAF